MFDKISEIFKSEKIEYCGILSLRDCHIINQNLFERKVPFAQSVIIFLVPYFAGDAPERNISLYAVSKNYHDYLEELFCRICPRLSHEFKEHIFVGMGDHSPIAETHAAAAAGLGIIGDNYRLINRKYGSFVFIGGIFTDMKTNSAAQEIRFCEHCGACTKACPSQDKCLSEITQRKGELTEAEKMLMKKYNTAWGCDICQLVCPHNKEIPLTPIDFFKNDLIFRLTPALLDGMSDKELAKRAFGWRKRKTIERNINLLARQ